MSSDSVQIGYLLKQAQAVLHSRMEAALRPLGLSVSHYACLHLLAARPGISAADLARDAFVTRQSMNALLRTLVERGLVDRPPHAPAGRALPSALTDAGRDLLRRAEVVVDDVESRMLSGLSDAARQELGRGLSICIDALS
ncbi:MAG: MarR family winged helix-turn-helix transcriptional regulator [Pseudolysinimonas sp.]